MLTIGLSGVPGSGKSILANALQSAIELADLKCQKCTTPVTVVDNYVEQIEERTDLALGFHAGYIGNFHVALDRAALERVARNQYKTVITCGTVLETATYAALALEKEARFASTDAEQYDVRQRVEATFRSMACFTVDLMRYDRVYYCPPITPTDDERVQALERNLQAAYNAFSLVPVVVLDQTAETVEELTKLRVERILEDLNLEGKHGSNVAGSEAQVEGLDEQ